MSFGEPVSNEKGKIVVAVAETAVGHGGFVELVNTDGDQFDLRSGIAALKKISFFL